MAAPSKRTRVARLLLKAVRGLPEKEQQVVLEHLVEAGLSPPGPEPEPTAPGDASARSGHASQARTEQEAKKVLVRGALGPEGGVSSTVWGALGPAHQMVPVRLSEPQHRLLKEWCAEHNFPMAVVIRGLVERFLEGQGRRAS